MNEKLLTADDICDRYSITKQTVMNWVKEGAFPQPLRLGSSSNSQCIRWSRDDIEQYESESKLSGEGGS